MPIERRGVRALQIWCRRVTDSYENVNILNMDSSWRDGLAFCALIHHFRPSLIDYDSLSQENILENNTLAYKVAEDELGIPSLLDPEDMLDTDVTYVSQFLHKGPPSLSPGASSSPPTPSSGTTSSPPSTPHSPSHPIASHKLQGSLLVLFVRILTPRLRFVKRGDMRPYKLLYLE